MCNCSLGELALLAVSCLSLSVSCQVTRATFPRPAAERGSPCRQRPGGGVCALSPAPGGGREPVSSEPLGGCGKARPVCVAAGPLPVASALRFFPTRRGLASPGRRHGSRGVKSGEREGALGRRRSFRGRGAVRSTPRLVSLEGFRAR